MTKLNKRQAELRLDTLRFDVDNQHSRLLTEDEHRALVSDFIIKFGNVSEATIKNYEGKYDYLNMIAAQNTAEAARQADRDENIARLKEKYGDDNWELALRLGEKEYNRRQQAKEDWGTVVRERAEAAEKRRKRKYLTQIESFGGSIQTGNKIVTEYSGGDLDRLLRLTIPTLTRNASESDTDFRQRWLVFYAYDQAAQERETRRAGIARVLFAGHGTLPAGSELEELLLEYDSVGGNSQEFLDKQAKLAAGKKETYDKFEKMKTEAEATIFELWETPKPEYFVNKFALRGKRYVHEPLGFPGKMIVRIKPNGTGKLTIFGDFKTITIADGAINAHNPNIYNKKWKISLTKPQCTSFLIWVSSSISKLE